LPCSSRVPSFHSYSSSGLFSLYSHPSASYKNDSWTTLSHSLSVHPNSLPTGFFVHFFRSRSTLYRRLRCRVANSTPLRPNVYSVAGLCSFAYSLFLSLSSSKVANLFAIDVKPKRIVCPRSLLLRHFLPISAKESRRTFVNLVAVIIHSSSEHIGRTYPSPEGTLFKVCSVQQIHSIYFIDST
jgi:hypothetical protein